MDSYTVEDFVASRKLKALGEMKGSETSLISLYVPGGTPVARVVTMLKEEKGKASHIKSRVNRSSVQAALTACHTAVTAFGREVPTNGVAIFAGKMSSDKGGDQGRMSVEQFVPRVPIARKLYRCGSRFVVDPLLADLGEVDAVGFIVIDGKHTVVAKVGSRPQILHELRVQLPRKHGRGGQSAVRFARLRLEARNVYANKVAELAAKYFIGDDNMPSVTGLILAGSGDFKRQLATLPGLDHRLSSIVLDLIDLPYGGRMGLMHAIEKAGPLLRSSKIQAEREALQSLMEAISCSEDMYALGVRDVTTLLQEGAVSSLVVWEDLDSQVEGEDLVEWLAQNHAGFGVDRITFCSDATPEGAQLARGLGGIGAVLRYPVDLRFLDSDDEDDYDDDYSDSDSDSSDNHPDGEWALFL